MKREKTQKTRRLGYLVAAVALLGASIGLTSPSQAYVQKLVIDQTVTLNVFPIPLGSGSSTPSTTAVNYTVYWGRVFGILNPNDPRNSVLTDINLAVPVSGGYSYIANFEIVTPTNPAQRSGLLIHAVSNRGGAALFSSGVLPAGNAALIAGATYVASGWQGDLLAQCTPVTPVDTPYPACFDLNSGPYGSIGVTGNTVTITPPTVNNVNGVANLSDFVVQVPVATTDGNPPNGTNTITGPVYSHVCTGNFGCGLAVGSTPTPTLKMQIQVGIPPYMAASLDTSQAQFWTITSQSFTGVDTGMTTIPSAAWSWAYCPSGPPGTPNPNWICLGSGTFNPNLMYEMVYTAANPLVLGVGFAAFSDLASFLRYGTTAPGGGSNPIAGTVTKTIIDGVSQSGGFIRGLIFYGFNEDENGRIVYDGAWPDRDSRMFWMNERWAQPEQLMYLYEGGDEAPVWYADYPNLARGLPAAGLFDRCTATGTCPQVVETYASAEIMSEKESSSHCGFTCVADIPLPPNDGSSNHVYRYFQAGSTHGGGTATFNYTAPNALTIPVGAEGPNDVIPETYTDDALFDAFIKLLMNGTPMPPSVQCVTYPGLSCANGSGQLVSNLSQATVGFPNIPGFPYYGNQAWRPFVYNYGPGVNYTQQSGVPTIAPPAIGTGLNLPGGPCNTITPSTPTGGVCPLYVPTVNADGNDNGGSIPSVLFQAPLATYVGWNLSTIGWYGPNPINGQPGQPFPGAGNSGTYYPFWDTKANRTSAGDPRLSLEERYGSNNGYKCVARVAANDAIEQSFLLPSDANLLMTGTNGTVTLAAPINTSNVLASGSPGFVPTIADTSLANTLCDRTDSHDFNSAGRSDILWRDTSGDVAMWLMNGATISSSAGVGTASTAWTIVGQRDFNGDGNADILWHDTSGDVALWLMNGSTVSQSVGVGNVNPSLWSIVGTGDFNGDGKGDILWRDTSGDVSIWLMNGASVTQSCFVSTVSPTTWSVVGVGDFNGDGTSDILWEDTSGDVAVWFMNGCSVAQSAGIGKVNPSVWSIAGTGDFNGDGYSDILWHDTSGDVAVWLMNGASVLQSAGVGNASPIWSVAVNGDLNGDGYSDIVWQDPNGDVALWEMNGAQVIQSSGVGTASSAWRVQGLGAD